MTTNAASPAPRTLFFSEPARQFLADRHLATLSTTLADGTIHVVPVGFVVVDSTATIITSRLSQKVLNVRRSPRATICQVDGARWLTVLGAARIEEDAASVAQAVERYAGRYRQPRVNPERVVIVVEIERILGLSSLGDSPRPPTTLRT